MLWLQNLFSGKVCIVNFSRYLCPNPMSHIAQVTLKQWLRWLTMGLVIPFCHPIFLFSISLLRVCQVFITWTSWMIYNHFGLVGHICLSKDIRALFYQSHTHTHPYEDIQWKPDGGWMALTYHMQDDMLIWSHRSKSGLIMDNKTFSITCVCVVIATRIIPSIYTC